MLTVPTTNRSRIMVQCGCRHIKLLQKATLLECVLVELHHTRVYRPISYFDGTSATILHAQSTIATYTELHAECDRSSTVGRSCLVCRHRQMLSTPNLPMSLFTYLRRAVTKFSKSRVWVQFRGKDIRLILEIP